MGETLIPVDRPAIELDPKPFEALVGVDLFRLTLHLAPTKILSRIHKALDHYTKALRLVGVDDEMGAIRCIAAEEELVVAIFEWLKLNADKVPEHRDFIGRSKNHRVKLAFVPVLSQFRFAIGHMLVDGVTLDGLEDVLHWRVSAVCVGGKVKLRIDDETGKQLILVNPLDLAVSHELHEGEEVIDKLYREFAGTVMDQRGETVKEFVSARAEYRNKLLYAEDGGFVQMDDALDTLIEDAIKPALRDLLWCLAVLLSDGPLVKDWGLISQFIALYRRVLDEAKI